MNAHSLVGRQALAAILVLASASVALAQTVNDALWGADGGVTAILRQGGTIYVGGGFRRVGPVTGEAVALDPITGAARQPFPKVTGSEVLAIAPDGSGGWYLGGG